MGDDQSASLNIPGGLKPQEVVYSKKFLEHDYDTSLDLPYGDRGVVQGTAPDSEKVSVKFDVGAIYYVDPKDISREKVSLILAGGFKPQEVIYSKKFLDHDYDSSLDLPYGDRGVVVGPAADSGMVSVKFDVGAIYYIAPKDISREKVTLILAGGFKLQEVIYSKKFMNHDYDSSLNLPYGERGVVVGPAADSCRVSVKFDVGSVYYIAPKDISREKVSLNLAGGFKPQEVVWSKEFDDDSKEQLHYGDRGVILEPADGGKLSVKFDVHGVQQVHPNTVSREKVVLQKAPEEAKLQVLFDEGSKHQKVLHISDMPDEKVSSTQFAVRVNDVVLEKLSAMPPIRGVMQTRLLPIEKAIERTGLSDMLAYVHSAKVTGEQNSKTDPYNLTIDEIAAIWLYTSESALYPTLNKLLRDEDRSKLKPFFYYLRILLPALRKIKKVKGTVYRGVKLDLSKKYQGKKIIVWAGFSSTSTNIATQQSEMFCGKSGDRTLFNIKIESGIPIKRYSAYRKESEVLLLPMTEFEIEGFFDAGHGLTIVQLKERVLEKIFMIN